MIKQILLTVLIMIGCVILPGCSNRNQTSESAEETVLVDMETIENAAAEGLSPEIKEQERLDKLRNFSTPELEAFGLMGDVHTVRYDSIYLEYDTDGHIQFFGFNDSINLFQNVEYETIGYNSVPKSWGADGWKFDISISSKPTEAITAYFAIHYPDVLSEVTNKPIRSAYEEFYVEIKRRPGQPSTTSYEHKNGLKCDVERYYVESVKYRPMRWNWYHDDHAVGDTFNFKDYKYDKFGNWIERTMTGKYHPSQFQKRQITYYSDEGIDIFAIDEDAVAHYGMGTEDE